MSAWSRRLGLALALLAASCARSPDEFCGEWVAQSCQALAGCCVEGLTFDPGLCEARLTAECRQRTLADFVKTGIFGFDASAARECLQPITSCTGFLPAPEETFEHRKACANMFDGPFSLGLQCSVSDFVCAHADEHATCYQGVNRDNNPGVCAAVVRDEQRCSFARADNTLHVCPDDKFCDLLARDPLPSGSQADPSFEFSAPCRARIAAGESCFDPQRPTDLLPCARGLYCEETGSGQATCMKQKPAGATCSSVDACAPDLFCPPPGQGLERTCRRSDSPSLFCVAKPVCGDTICQMNEDAASCPEDCNTLLNCGTCACVGSPVVVGCREVCDADFSSPEPDLCNGSLASARCAACVETVCGFDIGSCNR
ncbi:MAG: hypothetical protein QM820_32910 [Minicystis sp.]